VEINMDVYFILLDIIDWFSAIYISNLFDIIFSYTSCKQCLRLVDKTFVNSTKVNRKFTNVDNFRLASDGKKH